MHDTLDIKNWKWFLEKYESIYFEGLSGRFLLRKDRQKNLAQFAKSIARAYKTAQRQEKEWADKFWHPLFDEMKAKADNKRLLAHAKPVKHKNNSSWWLYNYHDSGPPYGWAFSFKWVDKPDEPLNLDLGQRLYEVSEYRNKFNNRIWVLKRLLERVLFDLVYRSYDRQWLYDNQFSGQIVKINLLGDEYWFNIGRSRHGQPIWENFVWQSNNTVEINLQCQL